MTPIPAMAMRNSPAGFAADTDPPEVPALALLTVQVTCVTTTITVASAITPEKTANRPPHRATSFTISFNVCETSSILHSLQSVHAVRQAESQTFGIGSKCP